MAEVDGVAARVQDVMEHPRFVEQDAASLRHLGHEIGDERGGWRACHFPLGSDLSGGGVELGDFELRDLDLGLDLRVVSRQLVELIVKFLPLPFEGSP